MITVNFFTTLRLMLKCREVKIEPVGLTTILDLLERVETVINEKLSKKILWKLLEEDGSIKRGTIILINGRNVLDSDGLDCPVSDEDTIALFPPGGGG